MNKLNVSLVVVNNLSVFKSLNIINKMEILKFRSFVRLPFLVLIFSFGSSHVLAQAKQPLNFEVKDAELKIKPPYFSYDLESTKGLKLQMSEVVFDDQSVKPSLHGDSFKFEWNKKLIQGGELSVIDRMGTEKWHQDIKGDGSWSIKFKESKDSLNFKEGERYRFCLKDSNKEKESYVALCSRWYGVENRNGSLFMGAIAGTATPRAIYQQEEAKLKGRKEVGLNTPVQFFATLSTGDSYEFRSEPQELKVKDMSLAEEEDKVYLTAELPVPVNHEPEEIKGENYSPFVKVVGFEKTIDEKSDYWKAKIPIKNAVILLPGSKGGVFVYELEIKDPPSEKYRHFLNARDSTGTYKQKDKLLVKDANDSEKLWEFESPEKFKYNRSYLEIAAEKSVHKAYLDVYRGSAGEASFRLTGVATSGSQFHIFAEGHVMWWMNDIFGSNNFHFSRQRWGVSAKYFTSMTKLKEIEEGDDMLSVMQADIRYRLTPGIWEKDETVGLIGAYETVKVGQFKIPKMGAGVFWARSMPKVFDAWFSKLPYMKYPKWVDMEFIKYFSSMDGGYSLDEDYIINFHGKVLWTPRIFGEAGFGIKNYFAQKKSDDIHLKLTTFYGTVGLGINF